MITKQYTLWCDEPGCNAWVYVDGETETASRRDAANHHWFSGRIHVGAGLMRQRDLCFRHRPDTPA